MEHGAYTVLPSALRASARGVSPKSTTLAIGVPASVVSRLVTTSYTCTTARPRPAVTGLVGTSQFCPRRAVVTKARVLPGPANRMSRGSSQVSSVRTTRGGLEPTRYATDYGEVVPTDLVIGALRRPRSPRRLPPRRLGDPHRSTVKISIRVGLLTRTAAAVRDRAAAAPARSRRYEARAGPENSANRAVAASMTQVNTAPPDDRSRIGMRGEAGRQAKAAQPSDPCAPAERRVAWAPEP